MPSNLKQDPDPIKNFITKTQNAAKYRNVEVPEDTLVDLINQANSITSNRHEAEKIARQKLHNIIAPYLGDPDYRKLIADNSQVNRLDNENAMKAYCTSILQTHASTRERLQILDDFYPRLFQVTGRPKIILDLACGLNPFTLPWMGLSKGITYYAYDIHKTRIDFIQSFFDHYYPAYRTVHADILITPPSQEADVAFLFKEAHRMEQRMKGFTRRLLHTIQVEHILLSLPPASLTGRRSLLAHNRQLINEFIEGTGWQVTEVSFLNELVYCIKKN